MPSLKDISIPNDSVSGNKFAAGAVQGSNLGSGVVDSGKLPSSLDLSSVNIAHGNGTVIRSCSWHIPEYTGSSIGSTRYSRYDQIMDWSYSPASSSSTIMMHFEFTYYGSGSTGWPGLFLGRVRDSNDTQVYYHTWNSMVYANSSSGHYVIGHSFPVSSWGADTIRTFTYEWARHPGSNTGYVYQRFITIHEVE